MAEIELIVSGVKGTATKNLGNKGEVTINIDKDNRDNQFIKVDAFVGCGENYKNRDESLILIVDKNGIPIFCGNFDKLADQLKK